MGLRRFYEKRAVSLTSPMALWERDLPGAFARTFSGKNVSQKSARNLIAVYSCQSRIADAIASLPIDHFRKVRGRREPMGSSPRWIEQPNPVQTKFDFWHRVAVSLLSDGNAFIVTVRGDGGQVVALYVLAPDMVQIEEPQSIFGTPKFFVNGTEFGPNDILHIPAFSIAGQTRGLSPIDVAREAIGLGLSVEEYGARFFAQGTTMAGIIEHPGKPSGDEVALLRKMFRKTHAGVKNSHAVGVLTGGASFKPITIRPDQAQFLETRRYQKSEIALLYRVPAFMVDPTVTSSWGSGIEEQNRIYFDDAVMPWVVRIEEAVSTFLLPGPQYIKFNVDSRMRPKTQDRYTSYQSALQAGWMNKDEVRALEDMEPIPAGKGAIYYAPMNMAPLGTPVTPKKTPVENPATDTGNTDTETETDE